MPDRSFKTRSEAETAHAGKEIGSTLRAGDVVLLIGDLGLGKTVFARGLAHGLGVAPDAVHSPTFTLINQYRGRLTVHHIDLYRIDDAADLDELGLEEILGGDNVTIVEWAERLGPYRVPSSLKVTFVDRGGNDQGLRSIARRHRVL